MRDIPHIARIVIPTSILVFAGSGCTTCMIELNGPAGRFYQSRRNARWAADDSTVVVIADAVPHGGVLYEPYPAYEEFARVVVVAATDSNPLRSRAALVYDSDRREEYDVVTVARHTGGDGGVMIEARDGTSTLVLDVCGRRRDDFPSLLDEANTLFQLTHTLHRKAWSMRLSREAAMHG